MAAMGCQDRDSEMKIRIRNMGDWNVLDEKSMRRTNLRSHNVGGKTQVLKEK